jgi:tetratricopeptide (TPR) repeat protein
MAYVRYVKASERSTATAQSDGGLFRFLFCGSYWFMLLFFACALMSKPMLVTWPFVFFLLDFWPLGRTPISTDSLAPESRAAKKWPPLILEKLPMLLMSGFTCYMTTVAQTAAMARFLPIHQRLENALMSYVRYLEHTLWTAKLAAFYPYATVWPLWQTAIALVVVLLVSVLLVRAARSRPYLLCGWLWYLGMLVPVIGIIQVGAAAMADRYTYLPLVGIFFAVVWWCDDLLIGIQRRTAQIAAGIVISSFAWCTHFETMYWHDTANLFQKAILATRYNFFAYSCLGDAYLESGNSQLAAREYENAMALVPNEPRTLLNYGNLFSLQQEFDKALVYYQKAVAANTNYAEAHFDVGNCMGLLGRLPEAEASYRNAIRLMPDMFNARVNMATVLAMEQKFAEAADEYDRALFIAPRNPDAHFLLGSTLGHMGQWEKAVNHFRRSIQLRSDDPGPMNDLAWILANSSLPQLHAPSEAVTLAEKACALTSHSNPGYLDTLAVAYAKLGRFPDAIRWTERARTIAAKNGDGPFVTLMEKRLRQYSAGRAGEFPITAPQITSKQLLDQHKPSGSP